MKINRIILLVILMLTLLFFFQRAATERSINGMYAYLPYLALFFVVVCAVLFRQKIGKWIGLLFIALMGFSSCFYVPSDKIGVRVENFGKTADDFKLVYGKFPQDLSASSWNIEYPGQSFGIPFDGFNVYCKDGVSLWCDPSILCELIRTDESCRKYAFKFAAYKDEGSFQTAIHQVILKEGLDAIRDQIGASVSDSILFERGKYEIRIQDQLRKALDSKYGINLSQFSVVLAPPESLQQAINDRLLAQEETKKTMASLQNAEAKLKLAEIDQRRMKIESQGLTPEILRKMEIEYSYNAWYHLSKSQNKVFVSGNPVNFMVGDR